MGTVDNYSKLLLFGFFTGIALASFSVGVAFVSGWYPAEKQGFALGVYCRHGHLLQPKTFRANSQLEIVTASE